MVDKNVKATIMDKLVGFFLQRHFHILEPPIAGRMAVIKIVFNEEHQEIDFDYYWQSLVRDFPTLVTVVRSTVIWLDIPGLLHFHSKLIGTNRPKQTVVRPTPASILDHVMEPIQSAVVSVESDVTVINSAFVVDFPSLYHQLEVPLATDQLYQMISRAETKAKPFYPVCEDHVHQSKLQSAMRSCGGTAAAIHKYISKNRVYHPLVCCTTTHTHFIPIITASTEASLGDCSYLDGCHKRDNCRYVHYLTLDPVKPPKLDQDITPIDFDVGVPFRARDAVSLPQWITCDIRHFPLSMLGKFAAIIADPAWNIHMNAPYDSMSDGEVGALDLPSIQDEGIIMIWSTARTLERARDTLREWGYTVNDELLWIKLNQLKRTIVTGRTGHWLNHSKEHLVVGLKGSPKWLRRHVDLDYIVSMSRESSQKPEEVYDIVDRMVGVHARKLELYGRQHNIRPGWFTLGGQLTGYSIVEADVLNNYQKWAKQKPQGLEVKQFVDHKRPVRVKTERGNERKR